MCGLVVVLVAVAVGWFGREYYDDRNAADNNDAAITIQQAQRNNQSAGADIGNAAAQIESAQSKLDAGQADLDTASGRISELQDRADADTAILDECQSLVDVGRINLEEARRIFADVDRENKLND